MGQEFSKYVFQRVDEKGEIIESVEFPFGESFQAGELPDGVCFHKGDKFLRKVNHPHGQFGLLLESAGPISRGEMNRPILLNPAERLKVIAPPRELIREYVAAGVLA